MTDSKTWFKLSLIEQMANIGSEVFRAIKWRIKNPSDSQIAFYRSLDLFNLTLADPKNIYRLREIARAKEYFAGWFTSDPVYPATAKSWNQYFFQFNLASRLRT
ncbi:MAG: hypothetical protein UV54_C0011G0005 [Candidatus Beckwithbacteria bacterium GW2011_GWA2_43_10]|uniref:Uncharacterized protein n=1 Tax=Candidatus Beckwithbacteria bacterium GW2011_GWA2_43_10 TaxID=1618369 RepID=A0A0G1F0B0_9BACT|nr:MAG: hypothetical protein UV54_C0011G0005 [Candidatus Beckwithbacteria bacterium GW2011_GWA2_43_10]